MDDVTNSAEQQQPATADESAAAPVGDSPQAVQAAQPADTVQAAQSEDTEQDTQLTDPAQSAQAAAPASDAPNDETGNADDDAAAQAVQPALAEPNASSDAPAAAPLDMPDLGAKDAFAAAVGKIELLDDVELNLKIELGRTEMYLEDVLKLGVGAVVELDKPAGDPVEVFVNERLIARGEVLVLNDNFCVRINEILSSVPEPD